MYQKIVAQNKTFKQGSLLAHEYTVIKALRHGLLSFTELHYLDESKIKQPEHLTFIQAAKATWQHEKEKPCLGDILSQIFHTVTHEGRTEEDANLLADSFDITEADKPPRKNDVYIAAQALRLSDSALLASNDDQVDGEELAKDADLISICSKSPIAQLAHEMALAAQFPRNTAFLTMLSVFSGLCCRYARVSYEHGGAQPTGLYFCGEQPPGAAKSRILKDAQAPIYKISNDKKKDINKAIEELDSKLNGDIEAEEKADIKDQIKKLKDDKFKPISFITNTTPEALDVRLTKTNGFFSIASAEQGAIDTVLGLAYKSDGKNNNDLMLLGYNADISVTLRVGRDCYEGKIIGSMSVIAQEGTINSIIKASGNFGIVDRFMLWSEAHLLGKRNHLINHRPDENVIAAYDDAVEAIYSNIDLDSEYEDLTTLSLSSRSWRQVRELKQELEPTLANGEENSVNLIRGLINKIDVLIMKVASVLHLSIDQQSTLIHDDRVDEAIALVKAYIAHVKGLMTSAGISMLTDREKLIIDLLSARYMAGKDITAKLYRNKQFTENGKASRGNVQKTVIALLDKQLIKASNKGASFNDTNFTTD